MQSRPNIHAVLLAAGSGSRFGGDKLLHPLADGVAIGARAARNLRDAGLQVTAVVRPGDARLAAVFEREGCAVTECANADRGMGASLAHGVNASSDADGWLIALADMPSIKPATLRAVVRELENGAAIVAPFYQGRRGHPVGFAKRFGAQLAALDGDAGARDIIVAHASELVRVERDDPGVFYDIDQKTDVN